MRHLKRCWPYYLVTLLVILGGIWLLRREAIGYYAHARTLRLICVIGQWSHINCTPTTATQIHHLEYLGGKFDVYAVCVGLLFGFIWGVVLYINTYMSALYDNDSKSTLAATRAQRITKAGKVTTAGFDELMEEAMDPGFVQATSGAWLTT